MNSETGYGKMSSNRFYEAVIAIALFLTLLFAITALLPAAFSLAASDRKLADAESASNENALTEDILYENVFAENPSYKGVFRMHILANSDSERDQQIKLAVRDAVLAYEIESTDAADAKNSAEAERILAENGAGILEAARSVLRSYGAEYDAQLLIGTFDFPERQYGETTYPAGEYRAMRILLGDAEGKNWWCVMFPPLCIVEANTEKIENETPIRFDSLLVRLWNHIFGGKTK